MTQLKCCQSPVDDIAKLLSPVDGIAKLLSSVRPDFCKVRKVKGPIPRTESLASAMGNNASNAFTGYIFADQMQRIPTKSQTRPR